MSCIEESSFPVVCIQEHDAEDVEIIDANIFFTFDARYDEYVLWGNRCEKTKDPFMFRFDRFNDMYNFIDVCLLENNNLHKFSLTLYNYNNFPMDFNVSYDFLYKNMDESYEIASFINVDVKDMTKSYLRKCAHICRYSYNRIESEII